MFGHLLEVDPQTRVCGNCDFWKGYRRKDETGRKVLIDKNGSAKCTNKWSQWNNLMQLSLSTCPAWSTWTNLKN